MATETTHKPHKALIFIFSIFQRCSGPARLISECHCGISKYGIRLCGEFQLDFVCWVSIRHGEAQGWLGPGAEPFQT